VTATVPADLVDVALPAGTRLVSLADRPDLTVPMARHNGAVWPRFMLQDPVADRLWHHLDEEFAAFQVLLLDDEDAIVAAGNSAPLSWDGTDEGLPAGWDDQLIRTVDGAAAGVAPNTLGALQIVVAPGRQGAGISATMVAVFRGLARANGFGWVIACVRPNQKSRYPLMAMPDYAAWRRDDGLPFDAWLRVHERAGGRIVRAAPESMRIEGSIAEWRTWTGLAFPVSGPYVVEGGVAPVDIDVAADRGVYLDANVWVVHRV
jgi:GNAT superfamily N-acetyltransferase